MDTVSILSRRTLLKASSCLVAAASIAPIPAASAAAVSEALTALLDEYVAAARGIKESNARLGVARRERGKAAEDAALWFQWPDGKWGTIGDTGNSYHPEYALKWLAEMRAKTLAAVESDEAAAEVRAEYAKTARQIRRLARRYDVVVAGTDYPAAVVADSTADFRFRDAKDALCSYRPQTMPEVAAIIRCISAVGPYPGSHTGIMPSDLADMLDASEVAA